VHQQAGADDERGLLEGTSPASIPTAYVFQPGAVQNTDEPNNAGETQNSGFDQDLQVIIVRRHASLFRKAAADITVAWAGITRRSGREKCAT